MSISTMKKITVVATHADTDVIVRKLMNLRCIQIQTETGETTNPLVLDQCSKQLREAEARVSEIHQILPFMYKYMARKKVFGRIVHKVNRDEFMSSGRYEKAWNTIHNVEAKRQEMDELFDQSKKCVELAEVLQPWSSSSMMLNQRTTKKTKMIYGSISVKVNSLNFTEALNDLNAMPELIEIFDETAYYTITYLTENEKAVMERLNTFSFQEIEIPLIPEVPSVAIKKLYGQSEKKKLQATLKEEEIRAETLNLDDVEILCDIEQTTVNLCLQKQKLALTKNCAILSGWVPAQYEKKVLDTLSKFDCACDIRQAEEGENPPVHLKNNAFAKQFEWVIGMYSYPKYGSYDPTFVMSIFYFLIFGIMFADVGYGLLLTLGCFFGIRIMHPKESMKRMLCMFGLCGISCTFMGVLFGGWFGDLPTAIMENFLHIENAAETPIGHFFSNGLIMNPISSPVPFLVLAIGLGEVHIVVGMFIDMVEKIKHKNILEGIFSNVPYWILFAGVDMLAPSAMISMVMENPSEELVAKLAEISSKGLYVFLAGIASILLLKGIGQKSISAWLIKGLAGLYSIISYASDLLSYSRILALGLVAGVIAQVINMLVGLGTNGFFGFIFMLIILVVGHLLNIAINLIGTFVHAARLQYIEFFGKFYDDGGEIFKPAVPADDFTEDEDISDKKAMKKVKN